MKTNKHFIGLTDQEVLESRKKNGVNILTPPKKETVWTQIKETCKSGFVIAMFLLFVTSIVAAFIYQDSIGTKIWMMPTIVGVSTLLVAIVAFFGAVNDPLFKILIIAFILSMGISIYEYEIAGADSSVFFEPVGIIVALILATGVAYFLEKSNEKTFQSLNEVNDDTLVKVIRNNNTCQVPRKDIVVGDIVLLEAGEEVPADCELLESLNLNINESSLTGELQCAKTTNPEEFDKEATYPSNQIMKGTIVIEGYCTAKVIRVGDKTEAGKVFEAAQVDEGEPTPLSQKLDRLAQLISTASNVIGGLIILGRMIIYFTTNENPQLFSIEFATYLLNTIMIAVTLIVVAVPEGLPMSVTLSLAFSMRKLMKENTLPRTMHSCETMGATSVICTDKTGTLTKNQMQVSATKTLEQNQQIVTEAIAANSTANLDKSEPGKIKAIGNPTEGALLLWLNSQNINYQDIREHVEIIDRLPFTTMNKYMATMVKSQTLGKNMLYVKGAPEIILDLCDITAETKKEYLETLTGYQNKAMRTLAIAYKELSETANIFTDGKLSCEKLNLAGIFGITDPVREAVPGAIMDCKNAGIQVKIVTGDTTNTAKEIGRQIGLWTENDTDKNIITGTEFAEASEEELRNRANDIKIIARARPNDKERFVKILKSLNHVVAVTGDGTNDAPALNSADVGLSMGDGTAVAKEASDMTIQDNSFSTIANAVMWGRSLYKNIQRFIMFQMTINVVACLIVLIGAFTGTESPLTVTQMLWVNLIMDTFAAIALASLPPNHAVMSDKPRDVKENIINKKMSFNILGVGGFFTILLLGLLTIFQHDEITSMKDLLTFKIGDYQGVSAYELSLFFTTFVMLQFWNIFNAKAFMTGKSAFYKLKESKGFLAIAFVIFVGQFLIVELGGKMFNVTPLSLTDWITIIGLTSLVFWIGELKRLFKKPTTENQKQ